MNLADATAVFAGPAAAAEVFYGANKIWPLNMGGWRQIGSNLQPPVSEDRNETFGHSVSMDGAGNLLAVGQPGFERLSQLGRVIVYIKSNNSWIYQAEIPFPQPFNSSLHRPDSYGRTVRLNAGGDVLAVSAPDNSLSDGTFGVGEVSIFQKNADTWFNIRNISGKMEFEQFGEAISLSPNGQYLAIGAPRHNTSRGAVRLYYNSFYNEDPFYEDGTLLGGSPDDLFGASVSISSPGFFTETYGTCVIVGAPGNDTKTGYARIFEYGGSWVPFNQTLTGAADGDRFGAAVAIDTMSQFCAVGAPNGGGNNRGSVTIYERDDRAWVQKGQAIIGEPDSHSGESLSLSVTGFSFDTFRYENPQITVAIGSHNRVAVYRWNGSGWENLGDVITGASPLDGWGASVSLNAAGNLVAAGAPLNNNSGHVRVFEYI